MFCPNCGTELPNDALFCPSCGTKIPVENEPTSSPTKQIENAASAATCLTSKVGPKKIGIAIGLALIVVAIVFAVGAAINDPHKVPTEQIRADVANSTNFTQSFSASYGTTYFTVTSVKVEKQEDLSIDALTKAWMDPDEYKKVTFSGIRTSVDNKNYSESFTGEATYIKKDGEWYAAGFGPTKTSD